MNGQNGRRQTGAVAGNPTMWDDGQTQQAQASRAGGGIAQIFDFEEYPVRIVVRDEEPWFCGTDVCRILGLGNASMAIKGNAESGNLGLDEDEWGVINHDTRSSNGVEQTRALLAVSESGIYALIFKSRKFRKWVTSEVLPALRKTGRYEVADMRQEVTRSQLGELRLLLLGTAQDVRAKRLTPGQAQAIAITASRYLETLKLEGEALGYENVLGLREDEGAERVLRGPDFRAGAELLQGVPQPEVPEPREEESAIPGAADGAEAGLGAAEPGQETSA